MQILDLAEENGNLVARQHRLGALTTAPGGDNSPMHNAQLPPLPCYLNGSYTALPDAKISVMDRGFLFGDGVYEVLAIHGGRPFCFAEHMDRLDRSLSLARIAAPLTPAGWLQITHKLIAFYGEYTGSSTENADLLVYLQVTRGVALRDHVMPQNIAPTVFAMTMDMARPTPEQHARGVACVTADDFRWEKANIKSTSLMGAVLARQLSFDADAAETVMFRKGLLSEASASNVWVVKDGTVMGPPKDHLVLEGIRYGLLEALCRERGIPFVLRNISREEVLQADELLLTSATKEVLAITSLDGKPVGNGRPGPICQTLQAGYLQAIASQPTLQCA
jgi:D-alanine transaminase